MIDPHAMTVATYHSLNADAGKEWLAYLILPSGRLPLAFFADSEGVAAHLAKTEWDKHTAQREANHRSREEAKIKAAATKARKAAQKEIE